MGLQERALVICGAKAHACVCALVPGHDGPHACGNDTGRWSGTYAEPDFEVVELPLPRLDDADDFYFSDDAAIGECWMCVMVRELAPEDRPPTCPSCGEATT